ncbi:hypothetical protein GDO86_013220 [Hymenochirus boettgeri]|uniref:FAM21/CAPZIP domain-containing protein n=1 Tax=Hymenochirus boettgeri TaxID=247094 RepID=A0A8T2IYJ1_9PIPI|nr:hypothetical protein GDO86_013220 [Hymenochirus boettgeri]
MNGPVNGSTDQPVWERPWALDEIRGSSQNWSLGADAGLLNFLREFSQQTISKTHEIEKQLDGLIREAKTTDCRLHNVFNDFLMLSNTQFIENRVYDEEVEEHIVKADAGDRNEQEKTREQKEAELIPKIQKAVNYGLQVLETAFEQLDIKAGNSDSEEEEVNEKADLILEPKDLYIDRPLPYLIGCQQFMQQEDVGLGDLSSEEGSVDNDRGSFMESEEEKEDEGSEDESDNISDEEKKLHSAMSDEDEDNGSDLFGDSDREEEEDMNDKTAKARTKSFADELAARIQGDVPKTQENDRASIASLEVKAKKEKFKNEPKKLPSDDEDDDLFKPPKLTDEDFSPFGNKGGLFSGGQGLFDDDEEGDLFADVQASNIKKAEPSPLLNSEELPSNAKKKPPVGGVALFPGGENVIVSSVLTDKEKKMSTAPPIDSTGKQPVSTSLFDDEDGFFSYSSANQLTDKPVRTKPASDLFADEDNLFHDKIPPPLLTTSKAKYSEPPKEKGIESKNHQVPTEKSKPSESVKEKQTRGLFSDEDDSETDLFSPSQSAIKSKTAPVAKTSKTLSLFDDEDEEDLFASGQENKQASTTAKPAPQTKVAAKEEKILKSGLFSSDEEDPVSISNRVKLVQPNQAETDAQKEKKLDVKKTSLFDEDGEDLFAVTKESEKKHHRVSLLFEDDIAEDGSLFASKTAQTISTSRVSAYKVLDNTDRETSVAKPQNKEELKKETKPPVSVSENNEFLRNSEKVKPAMFLESEDHAENKLFSSPPTDKHNKIKSKNVLSLFDDDNGDDKEENNGNHLKINNAEKEPEKVSTEKSSNKKSTGVFQDEDFLFSQELQKDNDPDVDLFASAKKQMPEKSSQSPKMGLFDDDEDDLFSTAKPKKPPKVMEKKSMNLSGHSAVSQLTTKVAVVKEVNVSKPEHSEENLQINPAAMLPGAVPKLSGGKPAISSSSVVDLRGNITSPTTCTGEGVGVSFEDPAQVDILHSANKTRAKVVGRRPPTRMGRKLSSQDSGEKDDSGESQSYRTSNTIPEIGSNPSKQNIDKHISTMKLSFTENDVQSRTHTKITSRPLTPDGNYLFGSDIFAQSPLPISSASKKQEASPSKIFSNIPGTGGGQKISPVLAIDENSDDDLFQPIKQKSSKSVHLTSHMDSGSEDDLFGVSKAQKKVNTAQPKETKPIASNIFEDDIFATEVVKTVKKSNEKKQPSESNLFYDDMDIFADLSHKAEKKAKKKMEPKSIFDDDMDDIFASESSKKSKQKVKASEPTTDGKSERKDSSIFDDPLNVFDK